MWTHEVERIWREELQCDTKRTRGNYVDRTLCEKTVQFEFGTTDNNQNNSLKLPKLFQNWVLTLAYCGVKKFVQDELLTAIISKETYWNKYHNHWCIALLISGAFTVYQSTKNITFDHHAMNIHVVHHPLYQKQRLDHWLWLHAMFSFKALNHIMLLSWCLWSSLQQCKYLVELVRLLCHEGSLLFYFLF